MARTYFILETCEDGSLTELGAAVHEALLQRRWLDEECDDRWVVWSPEYSEMPKQSHAEGGVYLIDNAATTSIEELVDEVGPAHVIPVGSVEFVNNFLLKHLNFLVRQPLSPIHALNIPTEIADDRYLDRHIYSFDNKQKLLDALNGIGETPLNGQVLVKPWRTPKRFLALTADKHHTYELENNVPDDEPLFVSEMLAEEIISEWRFFCRRGHIVDVRPYILDEWVCPNKELVYEMVTRLKGYPAITLDVAVLKNHQTVAIEVHNFISCGLYGFSGPKILGMLKAAWQYELKLQNILN